MPTLSRSWTGLAEAETHLFFACLHKSLSCQARGDNIEYDKGAWIVLLEDPGLMFTFGLIWPDVNQY